MNATAKKDPVAATEKLNAELAAIKVGDRNDPSATRSKLQVDPAQVKLQTNGQCFAEYFVRLPQGMIADDLKEMSIWRRVQVHPGKALKRHDRLHLTAFDESWDCEAIVAAADANSVTLAGLRIITIPTRTVPLFSDDNYRIIWTGIGYAVERRSDGHKMTQSVASPQLAERDLRQLYPQPVGR